MIHCGDLYEWILARPYYVHTPKIPLCSNGTTIEMIRCGNAVKKAVARRGCVHKSKIPRCRSVVLGR